MARSGWARRWGWIALAAVVVACADPQPAVDEGGAGTGVVTARVASDHGLQPRLVRLARIEGYGNPSTGELWARSVPMNAPAVPPGVGVSAQALGATQGYCPLEVSADGVPNDSEMGTFEFYNQFDATEEPEDEPSFDATTCWNRLDAGQKDAAHLSLFESQGVGCALQHVGNFSGHNFSNVMMDIDVFNGSLAKHSPYGPPHTTGTIATPTGRNAPYNDLGLWEFGALPTGVPGQMSGPHLKEMWIYFMNGDTTDFTWSGYLLGEVFEICGNSMDDDCDQVIDNGCGSFANDDDCYFDTDCASGICLGASVVSGQGEGGGELSDDVAGTCSCDVSDMDSDGVGDVCDVCPSVSDEAQADTDADGAGDACDVCPSVSDPGQADADGDGVGDACDGCASDMNKTAPGVCGCGISDADTDLDGTLDCNDACPSDMNKTVPGVCGCDISDADTDVDGTLDCNDGCPLDMTKTSGGLCGCGISDVDVDSDGHLCLDNCPTVSNIHQADADDNGIGDLCDLCPTSTSSGSVDFLSYPVQSGVPEPFELVWDDAGQTGVNTAIEGSPWNGFAVQVQNAPYWRLLARHGCVQAADTQILVDISFVSNGSMMLRTQGDVYAGANGYMLEFTDFGQMVLYSIVNQQDAYAGRTMIGSAVCSECTSGAKVSVRFQALGNNIRARWWTTGQSEPGTWGINVVNNAVTGAGGFGFSTYTNYRARFGRIAWSTSGAAAF